MKCFIQIVPKILWIRIFKCFPNSSFRGCQPSENWIGNVEKSVEQLSAVAGTEVSLMSFKAGVKAKVRLLDGELGYHFMTVDHNSVIQEWTGMTSDTPNPN